MYSSDLSSCILQSMCRSFAIVYDNHVVDRYKTSSITYERFKDLNMLVKKIRGYTYIDKLWVSVDVKGRGLGSKCFGDYLQNSNRPLVWRTRTQRLVDWYLSFDGVRTIGKYGCYHYFKYTHSSKKCLAWTCEDLDLFHEPSLIVS
jgi:acetylglutamate synthase